ncbi:hypothetical protein LOD99_15269 [Oopsacas minuta]|uniref:Uncharacterized protein n=1 Tax=Oopsacas minuta TaxID=111878 RepID=A0AAV7KBE5_9METZ|nr:hypothetical protein LOD99_15269 [Oopsacas minuta]
MAKFTSAKHQHLIQDSLFQKSFLSFTGKFNWLHFAKDCMITIVFPAGLRENQHVLAYWQWDVDAKGMHSKAEPKGVIDVLGKSTKPPYIRFFKDNYYWFEGEILDSEKVINLTMWDKTQKTRSSFQVALSFSK